ncbi:MAG: DUF4350 domain-containing protein [Candidatus Dormibacterales bacterium]
MKVGPARLLMAAGVAAAVVLVVLAAYQQQDSTDHRSDSDSPGGTSALRLYAAALGHPVTAPGNSLALPGRGGLLFVFSPDVGFTAAEAHGVRDWVSSGGVLVFADGAADSELDAALRLTREGGLWSGEARVEGPVLAGVSSLSGAPAASSAFLLGPRQVALVRSADGPVLALSERFGEGRAVAVTEPDWLTNAELGRADDGRLAADLIGLAPAGAPVAFDEYHHGPQAVTFSQLGWATTSWGAALIWAVVAVVVGLFLRGRGFGPRVPLGSASDRSSSEYVRAVGELLRRTGARESSLEVMAAAARQAAAQRAGLSPAGAGFNAALAARAPGDAASLADAEVAVAGGARSDAALLHAARLLHALVHPPAGVPPRDLPSRPQEVP